MQTNNANNNCYYEYPNPTMTFNTNSNSNQQQQLKEYDPRRLPCVATADFFGDALLSQLSFYRNTPLEVDFSRPPQNGWRWGRCHGRKGWLPDWAAQPVQKQNHHPVPTEIYIKPETTETVPVPSSTRRHSLRRSRKCIVPMKSITESDSEGAYDDIDDSSNGFDLSKNTCLGGSEWISSEGTPSVRATEQGSPSRTGSSGKVPQSGIQNLRFFRKASRVGSDPKDHRRRENPHTKDPAGPEWDGSEAPRIVSGVDGRVAVVEADGRTAHYRSERAYGMALAARGMAEKMAGTTKAAGHKLADTTRAAGHLLSEAVRHHKRSRKEEGRDDDPEGEPPRTVQRGRFLVGKVAAPA